MRIGLISGEYPPMQGGVGAYTQILAHHFDQSDYDVFIFTRPPAQDPDLPLTYTASWNLSSLKAIRQWAQSHQLDLLNLQFQTAAYQMSPWPHFLAHFSPVPLVTTFHDLRFPYLFPKAGFLRTKIVDHLARTSNGVIVTNHEDLQALSEKNIPGQLIPIGSNVAYQKILPATKARLRQQLNIPADALILAYFGFINHSKGLDDLIKAVAIVRERLPDLKVLMIGGQLGASDPSNAAYLESIQNLIQQHALEQTFIWTGFLEAAQVAEYMQTASLLILPFKDGASFRRGSLMAAIEQNCAIISTQPQLPIPEFQHQQNMLLVPPNDSQALAQQILSLAQDQALQDHLKQGTQALSQYFAWPKITQAQLTYFEKLLEPATGIIHE